MHLLLTNEVYEGTSVWGRKANDRAMLGTPVRVEKAVPALVSRRAFARLQQSLHARSPKVVGPRRVSSPYLLSGLLRCGSCGKAMTGMGAKSGRFHYYVCSTVLRSGRAACGEQAVPKERMEALVVTRILQRVLQEGHLERLVHLTNEELAGSMGQARKEMVIVDEQMGDVNQRLARLYDALETGKISLENLSPRIQELRQRRDVLLRTKAEIAAHG